MSKKITKAQIHEALHTVSLIEDMWHAYVVQSQAVMANSRAQHLAVNIALLMGELYQVLGADMVAPIKTKVKKNA